MQQQRNVYTFTKFATMYTDYPRVALLCQCFSPRVGTIDLQQHNKSRLISNTIWREILLHTHFGISHSHDKFSPTLSHSSFEFWLTNKSSVIMMLNIIMNYYYIDIVTNTLEVYEKCKMKEMKKQSGVFYSL